eukprot:comp18969_c0_seq1/m.21264 comp18969_c0_seq1/g.21264  ORF comp18969_c0_seq1/g.21264 comp18969_c0_seq1/m.21264 type:complete len:298 (-) comp18969_c0_seq1:397-1290(-)
MVKFAAVELGGTTIRVAICEDDPTKIGKVHEIRTTTPDETLGAAVAWLTENGPFDALGVASFGPVDLKKNSPTYGYITTTPKPHWGNTNVLKYFEHFNVPTAFDTDVNAPALAEAAYGGHQDSKSCAYITVGTGVGVGAVINGKTVTGLMHMEGGHILVPKAPGDTFEGSCPFHKSCVEGMVNSNALASRKGLTIHDLPSLKDDDPLWDIAAHYLAALCMNITLLLSPEVIVLSGGVLKRNCLFPKMRSRFTELLAGYVKVDKIANHMDKYLVPSIFGNNIGIISALELARLAHSTQ